MTVPQEMTVPQDEPNSSYSKFRDSYRVSEMIQRRFDNIVTYIRHRITNAASESINSNIQWVKYTARGFRNTKNFTTAIYFHCGGLDLMPATH